MTHSRARPILQCLSLALAWMGFAMQASATPPLQDRFILGANQGYIVPSECCWMPVPDSMRLLDLKVNEGSQCTAIGGPVGVFEHRDGKLWLTGFATCSRKIPLDEIYPEREGPALAEWLSGTFRTRVSMPCRAFGGRPVPALEQELTVSEGIVTAVTEKYLDHPACGNQVE